MFNKFYFIFAIATLLLPALSQAATVKYGNKAVGIAPNFAQPMQCIVDKLKQQNYNPKSIGCYAQRPKNRSAHPTGHACDVDQTARNVTGVNRIGSSAQTSIAKGCQAVSGCQWGRNPDCGHFEARSAPYSPAGAGVSMHYYGNNYASHPVKRRSPI
ncbi:MAG: hypothetical protein ACXVCI_19555 [Bdellovibrionota bacterium]